MFGVRCFLSSVIDLLSKKNLQRDRLGEGKNPDRGMDSDSICHKHFLT